MTTETDKLNTGADGSRDLGLDTGQGSLAVKAIDAQENPQPIKASGPCDGLQGSAKLLCQAKNKRNTIEINSGVFLSEGRADAAPNKGHKFIIKGTGFKYKYGF
jgi:hypothetical protein